MSDSLSFNNETLLYNNLYELYYVDPYNPLNLPPNTVRVRTSDGNAPAKTGTTSYGTATLVPGTTDVYDVYKSGTDFSNLFYNSPNLVEVLGANTTGITIMNDMFNYCTALTYLPLFNTSSVTNMSKMLFYCYSLTSIPLFDTSNVTNMYTMCFSCDSITAVPLFNTSKVTNMTDMFAHCFNVQTGALALYQQASTQAIPPSEHTNTFRNCGSNTVQGAAELAQIPADWK